MTIARQLHSRKAVHPGPVLGNPQAFFDAFKQSAHFDVQAASDLYWLGSQSYYTLDGDFGSLRLPFPTVWMEWGIPDRVLVAGKWESVEPQRVGILLNERVEGDNIRIEAIQAFSRDDGSTVPSLSPLMHRFRVDADGRYLSDMGLRFDYAADSMTAIEANEIHRGLVGNIHVACLALNLIHCKNVTTEEAGTIHVKRSGRQKRRGEPKITYRTIKLPGAACGGEETGEFAGTMPLHRVRGHFKTFTADAPLLGHSVGTYWWGWQVRGKKANGQVISDYELAR